ncbi:MAG: hypothetical protein JEZ00_14935 [Anaerolineaceae bacterium]|nr:hypothetical protein [Anaerolineaceae bacterium]
MLKVVSISLGSPTRNKKVEVNIHGYEISIERIGTGGNEEHARALFKDLDGHVDVLTLGGMDLSVDVDGKSYPIRAAKKLVRDVKTTPIVDGHDLKYVLERRVLELSEPEFGPFPHFGTVFIPTGIDRIGLAEALTPKCDKLIIGDLMLTLGIPIPVYGLQNLKRLAHILMPFIGWLPLSAINPPGSKDEACKPKHSKIWQSADCIAGDMLYIRKYSPNSLQGKLIITNTTTEENIELLKQKGVKTVITMSPRFDGRSFGTNVIEGVLTAIAGKKRPLTRDELNQVIDDIQLRPTIVHLT